MDFKLSYSYTTPKAEIRPCPEKGGFGLFAREPIEKDGLICVWGGVIATAEELADMPAETRTHGLQVEENIYMVPVEEGDPADYVNHSCEPNAGLNGQICLVAMRDIMPDEEICFDYAMSDSSDYDEFECHCGSPSCRGCITGNDWKIQELQKRYEGYFIPYLQNRIRKLAKSKTGQPEPHN